MHLTVFLLLALLSCIALADIPAECLVEQTFGTWAISFSKPHQSPVTTCNDKFEVESKARIILEQPNIARLGSAVGTWTLVYNQGVSIQVDDKSLFFFFDFETIDGETVSYCHKSGRDIGGWYHNLNTNEYGCITALRVSYTPPSTVTIVKSHDDDDNLVQVPITYTVDYSKNFDIPPQRSQETPRSQGC
ncbi:hypothetical protein GEMRC1_001568 [Eukaryota sp. GEM-RC1]